MNYRGLTVVGNSMIASAIAIVVPFVLLVLLSLPHIKPVNWVEYDEKQVDWGTFINVMFWWVSWGACTRALGQQVDNRMPELAPCFSWCHDASIMTCGREQNKGAGPSSFVPCPAC